MTRHLTIRAALLTGTLACLGSMAGAQSAGSTYADIDAGLGYATNPNLVFGPNAGSGFGRISARGVHAWRTERSSSSVSGFVENSTYFRKYGNTQIFSVSGATDYRASESLRLFGNVGFSGDLGGQLQSRFAAVPPKMLAAAVAMLGSASAVMEGRLMPYLPLVQFLTTIKPEKC